MTKQIITLIIVSTVIFSCANKEKIQTEVSQEGIVFDLEKVTFTEDISKLFSTNLADNDGFKIDSINSKTFSDSIFNYRIDSYLADEFNLKFPSKELGFLYKTPQIDSIAKFDIAFCQRMWVLTDLNKKPIAYYAEARFNTKEQKDSFIKNLKTKLGATKYEFLIDKHYHQCSYEWEKLDRTIQIETSTGQEMSFSTDNPNGISSEYYRIDILIIENKSKKAIHQAHLLKLPEKFSLKGKIDSTITYTEKDLKSLNLKKTNTIKDEFLLNSYFDEYVKDEYGIYQIGEDD